MEINYKLSNINQVAEQLIGNLSSKTILIYGEMGAGKTTFIKALVKAMGSQDEVSSPTFSIVNEYTVGNEMIYHFDLYRIKNLEDAYNLGIEDYIYSKNTSIVEWPHVIEAILPKSFDRIFLKINTDNSRNLKLDSSAN